MTKLEAQDALAIELIRQTGHACSGRALNDDSVTFGWFVRNRFLPLKKANWKEETAKVKELIINRDLVATLDAMPLRSIDRFTLQLHLNNLATTKSKDRVLQIRAYLRSIFAETVDQDFLVKDPARNITIPIQLRDTDRTVVTWVQLRNALETLPLADRISLELAMTNALRPSELFALRWRCFDHAQRTMRIVETVYKGKIRSWGKNRRSLGIIHIPKALADDLRLLNQQSVNSSPDGFIFANSKGTFIDTDLYRRRVLHRLARDLGIPKLTFQVIRRSIATLAQQKGTVKDVQGILRNSRTATTTDIYMQEIPESVEATIDAIDAELRNSPNLNPSTL